MKDYLNDGKEHAENIGDTDLRERLEKRSQERLLDVFDEIDKDSYEMIKEEKLADGLVLRHFELEPKAEKLSEQEKLSPTDYTSDSYYDASGVFHPGQIELDKLTDAAMEYISGDLQEDLSQWSRQSEQSSCAINAQRFVINALTDSDISEEEIIKKATDLKIYHEDVGTYPVDTGKLSEAYGLEYEQVEQAALEDLEGVHEAGGKTIVGINHLKLAYPNLFGFYRADHAVQVVGIDRNDPEDVRVILNDPGRDDGKGLSVPADVFLKTWDTSKRFMVAIYPEVEK